MPDNVGSELEREIGGRRREELGEGGWPSPAAGAGEGPTCYGAGEKGRMGSVGGVGGERGENKKS
jgi:hypothetical protein